MSNETTMPTINEAVLICPETPTGTPNVLPMSIRRSPVMTSGGAVMPRAKTSEVRVNLPEDLFSPVSLR